MLATTCLDSIRGTLSATVFTNVRKPNSALKCEPSDSNLFPWHPRHERFLKSNQPAMRGSKQ